MNKFFYNLVVSLVIIMLYTACEKENNNEYESSLVGKWAFVDKNNVILEITKSEIIISTDKRTYKWISNDSIEIMQQSWGGIHATRNNVIFHKPDSVTIKGWFMGNNEVDAPIYADVTIIKSTGQNLLLGKWLTSDYHAKGSDTIVFTENFYVRQYFDYIFANQVTPAMHLPPFATYSPSGDSIIFSIHYSYPDMAVFDEAFKYSLKDNSLTIKGFSNPFSITAEARSDVHFIKIE